MRTKPSDPRTLEQAWQQTVDATGNRSLSSADLENARALFMRGAQSALMVLVTNAPRQIELASALARVQDEIDRWMTENVAGSSSTH